MPDDFPPQALPEVVQPRRCGEFQEGWGVDGWDQPTLGQRPVEDPRPHPLPPAHPAPGVDPAGAGRGSGSTRGLSVTFSATGNPMSLLQQHSPGWDGALSQPPAAPVVKQGRTPRAIPAWEDL